MPTGRGRLLYRINNDSNLYGRGFSVENGLLSSLQHRVSGPGVDGTDWTGTNSLTVIDGKLYHSHSDGTLRRTDLVNGAGHGHHRDDQRPRGGRPGLVEHRGPARPGPSPTPPPPPPPPDNVYENHFDNLDGWTTLTGLTLDTTAGAPAGAPPSALADVNGTRAFARRALGASYQEICSAVSIRLNRQTTSTVLMRLRTADNLAGGRVFVAANGTLYIRSDVAGVQTSSGVRLTAGSGRGSSSAPPPGRPARSRWRSTAPRWSPTRGTWGARASAWSRSARPSTTTGPPTSTTWRSPSPPSSSKSGIPPAMETMTYGWTQPRCVRLRGLSLRNVTGAERSWEER